MPILYRASLGYLRRHPWQLLLAVLGITVGVGVVLAVDIANASARAAFTLSLDTLAGQSTHQIVGGPTGVDERDYVELQNRRDGAAVAPIVDGAVELNGRVLSVLGVDPLAEREFRTYTVPGASSTAAGDASSGLRQLRRFLLVPGAALVAPATARALGLQTGQTYAIVAGGRQRELTVVGELAADDEQYRDLLIVDIATAQEWFDSAGYLSRVDVRATPAQAAALTAALPEGTTLTPVSVRNETTNEMTSAFMTNLTAMSLLALLVGVFLIYNSVAFAVVQRRGLMATLRALGVTRRETFTLVMVESTVLAIVGVTLGGVAGIALGEQLLQLVSRSINDLYFRVAVTGVTLPAGSFVKAAGAGVAVTLLAAAVPALEAAGQRPALSLLRGTLEREARRIVPWLCVFGVATMVVGAIMLGLSGRSLVVGLAALFALIFGFAACLPLFVQATTRRFAPLAARAGGVVARLAVDGIHASLSRTGVAVVALAIAVSATIGVSVMVDSFRGAVEDWLSGTLQSDIYVGVADGVMDASLIDDIAALPAVREISSSRRVWVASENGRARVNAVRLASGSYDGIALTAGDPEPAWRAFEADQAVLVSTTYAYRHTVGVGDSVSLLTANGYRAFEVAAIYNSYDANQGAITISRDTYDAHWADDAVDSIGVYLAPEANAERVSEQIRTLSAGRQALRLATRSALTGVSLAIFDRTFVITNVLYWLAVGVAVIGILGAMLALQLERSREFATLRALGMTPAQMRALVIGQTTLIGLLSGLAAIPMGLLMAQLLIDVINRRSYGWEMSTTIDPAILLSAVLLAVGAALVAGLYPAYRVVRTSPALAMREE